MSRLLLATTCLIGFAAAPIAARAQSIPPAAPTAIATPSPGTLLPSPTPGPGTVSVRFNARFNFYAGSFADSGRNPATVTTTAGNPPVATNTKQANYTFGSYGRLFPAFDGVAANGLKYGALLEIRQDGNSPPGGGVNGSISQGTRNRDTLYYRRAYGYVSAEKFGLLRFGQGDGPTGLLAAGTIENFNDGGWNGDIFQLFSANTIPVWPFPTSSGYAGPLKVVYLSPQFSGIDFGISYEPNTGNGSYTGGNCPYANTVAGTVQGPVGGPGQGIGCDATSSTSTGDYTRRRNTIEAIVRYRTSFGPVGLAIEGGGIFSSKVADNATPRRAVQYDGERIGDFGVLLSYAGFSAGGHIDAGRFNGAPNALVPQKAKDEFAWIAGGTYAVGPFVMGASYYDVQSAGSKSLTSSPYVGNRNEYGIAAGGTYNFAPGMNIFLSYLRGHRKQLGVDFLTGVASTGTSPSGRVYTHNNVQAQSFAIGTQFRW